MSDKKASTPETPSVEKYNELKNKLTESILKKQELNKKLAQLEDSIYDKEKDYFNESTYGNIVKGFDNFSKTSGGSSSHKKRFSYSDDDHIFSLSSINYVKTLMKRQGLTNGSAGKEDMDDYEDTVEPAGSVVSTPKSETPRKRKARVLDD